MTEWHAVRAKIGAEGRALIGIEAAGMGAYLPIELIRKNHRGEREIIWRPLFPRYSPWALLLQMPGPAQGFLLQLWVTDSGVGLDSEMASPCRGRRASPG